MSDEATPRPSRQTVVQQAIGIAAKGAELPQKQPWVSSVVSLGLIVYGLWRANNHQHVGPLKDIWFDVVRDAFWPMVGLGAIPGFLPMVGRGWVAFARGLGAIITTVLNAIRGKGESKPE